MRLCGFLAVIALGSRVRMLAVMDPPANPITVYVLTWSRMDTLAIGAFIALATRDAASRAVLVRLARPLAPLLGAAALGLIMADAFVLPKSSAQIGTGSLFMTLGLTL